MVALQKADVELSRLKSDNAILLSFEVQLGGVKVLCDMPIGQLRLFILKPLRRKILYIMHNIFHPGIKATFKLVSERFVRLNMNPCIRSWIKASMKYLNVKSYSHTSSAVDFFP